MCLQVMPLLPCNNDPFLGMALWEKGSIVMMLMSAVCPESVVPIQHVKTLSEAIAVTAIRPMSGAIVVNAVKQ